MLIISNRVQNLIMIRYRCSWCRDVNVTLLHSHSCKECTPSVVHFPALLPGPTFPVVLEVTDTQIRTDETAAVSQVGETWFLVLVNWLPLQFHAEIVITTLTCTQNYFIQSADRYSINKTNDVTLIQATKTSSVLAKLHTKYCQSFLSRRVSVMFYRIITYIFV